MFGRTLRFSREKPPAPQPPDLRTVLGSLPIAVMVVDRSEAISFVNVAAEQLFATSATMLCGLPLEAILPPNSAIYALVRQALLQQVAVSEYAATLDTVKTGARKVTVQASPMVDHSGGVLLSFMEHTFAMRIGHQFSHRGSARSVSAMAAVLAHEVKNPLSGIRGAAQLLEQGVDEQDRTLTRLICDEADRIVKLVDRMEIFSEQPPLERQAVNIHAVLEHVRRLAENGFAKKCRIIEKFDPSLPPVWGCRDQLIQIFLNLVKNAAEACPAQGGEIVLSTGYHHGVRLQSSGRAGTLHLPLVVSIQDNGDGIPPDLQQNLFDPFVTTKANGSGLGLPLVAKLVNDHGGVVEFDSVPRRTVFRVFLPIVPAPSTAHELPPRALRS